MASASNETGSKEIYVSPLPRANGKWQVSSAGAQEPKWRQDGKELFYLSADGKMMTVAVKADGSFEADSPVANDSQLQCTETGQVLSSFKGKSVFDLNAEHAAELAKARAEFMKTHDKDQRLAEVRRLTGLRTIMFYLAPQTSNHVLAFDEVTRHQHGKYDKPEKCRRQRLADAGPGRHEQDRVHKQGDAPGKGDDHRASQQNQLGLALFQTARGNLIEDFYRHNVPLPTHYRIYRVKEVTAYEADGLTVIGENFPI